MALLDEDERPETSVGIDPFGGGGRPVLVDARVELEDANRDLAGLAILELDGCLRDTKNTHVEDCTLVFETEELTLTQVTGALEECSV
jgi:hypothetical protein